LGAIFSGSSDTEVVLKAYARWGEDCLRQFRGMFAFAIWDAKKQVLFVARDPMGIKPLYYHHSGTRFLFSSELRTLLDTGLVPRRISSAGLLNYLSFGSAYEPNTIIEGIRALRAGHYLAWENAELREVQYWDPLANSTSSNLDESPLADTLGECLRMQMVSDVPLGIFLSGGIDSTSLVALLARDGIKASTFSIVFRESDYTEAQYSRLVASRFSTDHHEILVSQHDALSAIPGMIGAMDQPTMDGLNTYLISRHTRAEGIKVALSGLGGDELFAGYSTFRTVPTMERFSATWRRVPNFAQSGLTTLFSSLAPASDQNRKLAALAGNEEGLVHPYFLARALFVPGEVEALIARDNCHTAACLPLKDSLERCSNLDPINRVSYFESRCYMLNTLLRDADTMSMAHGLEVRVPLLDHHLVRQVMSMSGESKTNGGSPKLLLVKALGDGLPDEIVHRKKRGFTLPFEHWLRDELYPELSAAFERIEDGVLGSILDPVAIRRVWQDFERGRTSWSRPWSLFVLQRWCELHLQGEVAQRSVA
jgi:asparagine synthase (glutamine-hydrolysing)